MQMQSAAALQFLGAFILVGQSQVSGFGTMPKPGIPDLSGFGDATVDTMAETANPSEDEEAAKAVIAAQLAAGWPFCTTMADKTNLGGDFCKTVLSKDECGYGDKVFRVSDASDDKFDACAWKNGKCKMAKYTYPCGESCLSYVASSCANTVLCKETGEEKCYTPAGGVAHSCKCSKVYKNGAAVWECDVHRDVIRRRLQEEQNECIVCGSAMETFCYSPSTTHDTVCDCSLQISGGTKVEVCGTVNLLKADDDEPIGSNPLLCTKKAPAFW